MMSATTDGAREVAPPAFAELLTAPRFHRTERFTVAGEPFFVGATDADVSLYAHDGDAVHFDLEGRWRRARLGAGRYLRGLDGAVLQRLAGPAGEDLRVRPAEAVHAAVVALVARALPGAPATLGVAAAWTLERLAGEAARFLEVYRPLGVVPPDRYASLILQLSEGCAHNGCLFCSLYKGQRFRVKSPEEFLAHVRSAKAFVGSNVAAHRGVFLGEANALAAPQATLHAAFDVLEAELPHLLRGTGPSRGAAAFVDAFAPWKSTAELAELASRGLTRIFLGVESGDLRTLAMLGKPASLDGIRSAVERAKAAGLSVGLSFLVGLGPEHVDASASLASELPLDERDVVYLSSLVLDHPSPWASELERRGLRQPPRTMVAAEHRRLHALLSQGRAQVARYDVNRFVYC